MTQRTSETEPQAISLAEIYSNFEAIGNNCEFGIVQRRAGFDPPGLFRNVGFLDVAQITRAIYSSFDGMFEPGMFDYSLPTGWPDWRLDCQMFGFGFHSTIPSTLDRGSQQWDAQASRVLRIFRYLKQKLLEDLAEGKKVFVYRSLQPMVDMAVLRLLAAIKMHGDGALLYVHQDSNKAPGTLEFRGDGLLVGSVHRLSNENPPVIDFQAWELMARATIARPDRIQAQPPNVAGVLPHIPVPENCEGLLTHVLENAIGESRTLFSLNLEGLEEHTIVTISSWVYFSTIQQRGSLSLVLHGYRTEASTMPDPNRVGRWQRLSISSRIPAGQTRAVVLFSIFSSQEGIMHSVGWTVLSRRVPMAS
jgi:hypothetical protein